MQSTYQMSAARNMHSLLQKSKEALPWGLAALVSTLLTVLALLPAAWFLPLVAQATAGRVSLAAPAGSLWHGSAVLMLAAGPKASTPTALAGRIEWRTAFWPLFSGKVKITMLANEASPAPVQLSITPRGAMLSSGRLEVPASLLTGLGAPFNTFNLQGGVQLQWNDWRFLENKLFGQLTLNLTDMSSRVSRVKPLGSYRVVIQALGRDATLALTTTQGPLLLDGAGQWARQKFSFRGTAQAEETERENLRTLLSLLGNRMERDVYALVLEL